SGHAAPGLLPLDVGPGPTPTDRTVSFVLTALASAWRLRRWGLQPSWVLEPPPLEAEEGEQPQRRRPLSATAPRQNSRRACGSCRQGGSEFLVAHRPGRCHAQWLPAFGCLLGRRQCEEPASREANGLRSFLKGRFSA